jgi:hypothetical protein
MLRHFNRKARSIVPPDVLYDSRDVLPVTAQQEPKLWVPEGPTAGKEKLGDASFEPKRCRGCSLGSGPPNSLDAECLPGCANDSSCKK